jgi:hypothetical protein
MFLLNVRDQVSHPYKTTENYTFYVLKLWVFSGSGIGGGGAWTGLKWLRIDRWWLFVNAVMNLRAP